MACPAATFAPAGANTSAACARMVYVDVSVVLPLPPAELSAARQLSFRQALADACGAAVERVTVIRAVAVRRASAAGESKSTVDASIAEPDTTAAAAVLAQLSGVGLNGQLVRQGLPSGSLLSVGVREEGRAAAAEVGLGLSVGLGLTAAAALAGVAVLWLRSCRGGEKTPPDELRLREAMAAVRKQVAPTRVTEAEDVREGTGWIWWVARRACNWG